MVPPTSLLPLTAPSGMFPSPRGAIASSLIEIRCVNSRDEIYSWQGNGWKKMPGGARTVSVGNAKNVWATNAQEQIWFWDGNSWTQKDGGAVQVRISSARDI